MTKVVRVEPLGAPLLPVTFLLTLGQGWFDYLVNSTGLHLRHCLRNARSYLSHLAYARIRYAIY